MMSVGRVTTAQLADEILEEFFSNNKMRKVHRRRVEQSNKGQKLAALADESESEPSASAAIRPPPTFNSSAVDVSSNLLLQELLEKIQILHNEVSVTVKEMQTNKDWSQKIGSANDKYVQLCQAMLAEVMKKHKEKGQSSSKELEYLKLQCASLNDTIIEMKEHAELAHEKIRKYEYDNNEFKNSVKSQASEFKMLKSRISELEMNEYTNLEIISGLRLAKSQQKQITEETIKKIKDDQKLAIQQQLQQMRQQMLVEAYKQNQQQAEKQAQEAKDYEAQTIQRTASQSSQPKEKPKEAPKATPILTKSQTRSDTASMFDLSAMQGAFKRPPVTKGTQTEVDECGVWDAKDGWTLPISGTAIARIRWRQATLFAKCPSCKGIGAFVATVARLLKQMQRGVTTLKEEKMSNRDSKWIIPDQLVAFVSNVPRSIQAVSPKKVLWAVRRANVLVQAKYQADNQDDLLGYPTQSACEFLIEFYLLRAPCRSQAEVDLYVFINTLKEMYHRHKLLHTFARMFGFLDEMTVEEKKEFEYDQEAASQALKRKKENERAQLKPRERTKIVEHEKEQHELKLHLQPRAEDQNIQISDVALSTGIMSVYLFARNCFLQPYHGVYSTQITKAKSSTKLFDQNEKKLNLAADEAKGWVLHPPEHVCADENGVYWVPLDRASRIMQGILGFLDDNMITLAFRDIENKAVLLGKGGEFLGPIHTIIRAANRVFLQWRSEHAADVVWSDIIAQRQVLGLSLRYFRGIPDDPHAIDYNAPAVSESDNCSESDSPSHHNNQHHGHSDHASKTEAGAAAAHSKLKAPPAKKTDKTAAGDEENNTKATHENEAIADQDQSVSIPNVQEFVILVDMEKCLEVMIEALIIRSKFVEVRLQDMFVEGDSNGDGVLSFVEFTSIVSKVAPHMSKRRVLKMFREALMQGSDNGDTIGPAIFAEVCKQHGVMQIVDLHHLKVHRMRALSGFDEKHMTHAAHLQHQQNKQASSSMSSSSSSSSPSRHISVPGLAEAPLDHIAEEEAAALEDPYNHETDVSANVLPTFSGVGRNSLAELQKLSKDKSSIKNIAKKTKRGKTILKTEYGVLLNGPLDLAEEANAIAKKMAEQNAAKKTKSDHSSESRATSTKLTANAGVVKDNNSKPMVTPIKKTKKPKSAQTGTPTMTDSNNNSPAPIINDTTPIAATAIVEEPQLPALSDSPSPQKSVSLPLIRPSLNKEASRSVAQQIQATLKARQDRRVELEMAMMNNNNNNNNTGPAQQSQSTKQ